MQSELSGGVRGAGLGRGGQIGGVLGQLLEKGQLSLELIKANITELMAGGVDTVKTYTRSSTICLSV